MPIHVLEPGTVVKLAAGEVIEGPAAVVRELLDNAIDSGAISVSVTVSGGGLDLIRVTDDGSGMPAEDLATCVRRHATSKITRIEDLSHVQSLGFRGEALHAVSGVSRLTIRTDAGGATGYEAHYEGERVLSLRQAGCPRGTTVEVRDLFYNTPARLRFLKGPVAETGRVVALVRRYILGRPGVAFSLVADGREQLRSPGSGDPRDAIVATFGWQMLDAMVPVEAEHPAAEVRGFVSAPVISKSNRSDMHVYINGRWVQSRPLLFAVQEAYSSLLMTGRFPVCVLYVAVPPDRLDVNVHPAKSDVRFADERGVSSAAGRAVRSALLASAQAVPAPRPAASGIEQLQYSRVSLLADQQGEPEHVEGDPRPASAPARGLPPLRILGQLGQTYIIAEGPTGLCLVDQHAAHERVLLEKLQARLRSGQLESQSLLEPVSVPVSRSQAQRLDEFVAELQELGFGVEAFGADTLLIRSVPADVPPERAGEVVAALEEGLEGLELHEERQRAMLAAMACHSAIRAGQTLDTQEMRALIQALERTHVPTACAHGRPTMLELSQAQLEREFGRRGAR